ncbi:synaptic vesicle 2-related protein-like [Orbicella faveolata]|uniref:synaptic vesicle 2-related protein-like n=1 Tax=Orbicella faveolata TaxID=48498 RepID=UPI0009E61515|nr:synaptic vesicle 2-related protein-like [Orbicella faveolata]
MAKSGVELELKGVLEDSAAVGGKNLGSPKTHRPDYESLKEVNDNNENDGETFTLSEAVEAIGMGKFQILLILMAGFVNVSMGLKLVTVKTVFVGMAVGCPIWGWLSDNLGRKSMIFISASWLAYFGFISSFSPHYLWIVALRCLVGFGIGGVPTMYTLLIEFLPINMRSYIILCLAFFWALGSTFMVVVSLLIMPTLGWRWLLAFATLPVVIFIILCKWLPESPRYLLAAGEKEKGMEVLQRMAKINGSKLPPGTLRVETESARQGKIQVLFNQEYRLTTLLLWLIFFSVGVLYYGVVLMTTQVFQQIRPGESLCSAESLSTSVTECGCKLLTVNDYISLLWTTAAEFPGILFTMLFMERLGRKRTLAGEFFLVAASLALMYICTGRTLLLLFIFMVRGLSLGVFQGFFVYAPEVYPTIVRSIGFGCCNTWTRIGAMVTPYVAQVLLRVSWNLSLGVYISLSLMALVATLLLPYETKGRAMQEM